MWTTIFYILLAATAARAQLNFEGNPLTEETVYTAEESHLSERTAKAQSLQGSSIQSKALDSYVAAAKSLQAERAQKLYPVYPDEHSPVAPEIPKKTFPQVEPQPEPNETKNMIINTQNQQQNVFVTPRPDQTASIEERQFQPSVVDAGKEIFAAAQKQDEQPSFSSDSALALFLNSRTPGESQLALEHYLTTRQEVSQPDGHPRQPDISQITVPQQRFDNNVQNLDQQQLQQIAPVEQREAIPQQLLPLQAQAAFQSQPGLQVLPGPGFQRRGPIQTQSVQLQSRNGFPHDGRQPMYRRPLRRPQGGPYRSSSRIGGPGPYIRRAPPPTIDNYKRPVEVIYTKPPGFGHGPKYPSNPPVPYEDASAFFPDADADHPAPDKSVYYSQLYAQSYDPDYYNYIAKYGKIKPHLYGKFGKKDDSIWGMLYRGFKKHGMRHLSSPMFLLGLSIPTITMLLSAYVTKRSLGRSDSGDSVAEEQLKEYLERVQKALKCFEENAQGIEDKEC